MNSFYKFFIGAALLFLLIPQAWAQDIIYANDISSAGAVSDWTLTGVAWASSNNGQLVFSTNNTTATTPAIIPENSTNLNVTIVARYGDYLYLQTSPDGITWSPSANGTGNQFTGSSAVATASKSMPDGTRYVRFQAGSSGVSNDVYLISVTITGNAPCTDPLPVTGISLNKTSITMGRNTTAGIVASLTPYCAGNKNVTWSSDNHSVATVNSEGVVTALEMGEATITATSVDGGFKAQCNVVVNGVYTNEFPDAESVSEWTLNGVSWYSLGGRGYLGFNGDVEAIMPVLPQTTKNLAITFYAESGNTLYLHTSPDGVNYTNQGLLSSVYNLLNVTRKLPNGTRYVKIARTSTGSISYLYSVTVTEQPYVYENTFSSVESVSDWTLNGVSWSSDNNGQLNFSATSGTYATMPVLPQGNSNLKISVVTYYGNNIYLYTSTDDVNYTYQGNLTSTTSVTAVTLNIPDETRYLRLEKSGSSSSARIYSVTVYGDVCQSFLPVSAVILNKTSIIMPSKATESLTAAIEPFCAADKKVTWSSSDNNVATVTAEGLVTAVAPGEATITATSFDGVKGNCNIRVPDVLYFNDFPNSASVQDWTLSSAYWSSDNNGQLRFSSSGVAMIPVLPQSASNMFITVSGGFSNLHLSTSPDDINYTSHGTFSSTGSTLVFMKPMPDGTRYVKFTTSINNQYLTSVTVSGDLCQNFSPVAGISLNKTATTLTASSTELLVATITPFCAGNLNISWKSDNQSVATVNSGGKVTAGFPGTATITATTADGGFSAQCVVTVGAGSAASGVVSTYMRQWYSDREADNHMQFISGSAKYYFQEGQLSMYQTFSENSAFPCNINNDASMDFYSYTGTTRKLQVIGEDGETKDISLTSTATNEIMPCDYNSDGLTDFKIGDEIFIQGANSTFTQKKMNVMSRAMYEQGYEEQVRSYASQSSIVAMGGFGGFGIIGGGATAYVAPKEAQLLDMDLDGNGLPDLLNTQTGEILLNMGANIFVKEQLGGYVMFRDLTGNGRMDNVVFIPSTKTIQTNILQADGSWKTNTEMSGLLSLDNQIWAYDYNRDGYTDLILPFSYSASNAGAFLAVMVNDGKGNFTMKENTYSQQLKFFACADLDNDGYYDIVAVNNWSNSTGSSVVWLKGDAQYKFNLQSQPLYTSNGINDIALADINNDGKYELLVRHSFNGTNGVYPIDITASVCQPPQAPARPEFVYEPSTGYMKVSWQPATDPRYSSVDLTYEVRIGSAPGKGDIVFANAYADGRRRNLMDGNANFALEKLFDASSWNAGDYYISVQAINPMRCGSAFSQEAIFSKKELAAKFVISDEKTTNDLITVTLTGKRETNLEYIWDFDGGQVIESNADQTVMKLKFTAPGAKKITLQTRNTAGVYSAVYAQETFLVANMFTTGNFSFTPDAAPETFADLDNCGKLEALTNNGIYENDGKGNFTKLSKIFNTNFKATGVDFDYNNDGLMDIAGTVYVNPNYQITAFKNNSTTGDITFPMAGENLFLGFTGNGSKFYDFNNDGKADAESNRYGTMELYLNNGDYKNFTLATSAIAGSTSNSTILDFNKDGFLDAINMSGSDQNRTVSILLNNGKGFFTEKIMPLSSVPTYSWYAASIINHRLFVDINNDGYIDLLLGHGNNLYVYLNHRNESFEKPVIITLPLSITNLERSIRLYCAYDFDNNGYTDVYISENYGAYYGILYFYDNLQTQFFETNLGTYNFIFADVDGDGLQDIYGGGTLYKNNTTVANTAPTPPTNIRWAQGDETFLIEWDAATDAETPAAKLRYNLSVKKQGATGDNAYVISPLNGTKNGVPAISLQDFPYNPYYRTATRMEIPLTAFAAGETYEIQIQTLDGWNAVSDFSAAVVAKIVNNPQIKVPASVCADFSATIEYKGTGTPAQRTWNWGGGTLLSESGNFYEVIWNSEGAKTISVTVGGVTNEASLLALPSLNVPYLPASLPSQTELPVSLPNPQARYTVSEWYFSTSGYIYSWYVCSGGICSPISRPVQSEPVWKQNGGVASVTFPKGGYYTLKIAVESGCGTIYSQYYQIHAVEMPGAEIRLVTAENGKNVVNWNVPANLPASVNGVNIYKEGSKYNDFQLEESVPLSQTTYTDLYSNTNIMASRYRLAWRTEYGGAPSQQGKPHKGIHLMINKGVGNGWNLFWGQYEGAIIESFRVLRGSTPNNLTVLQEVAGSSASYSDLNPPAGDVYYAIEYNTVYTAQRSGSIVRMDATSPGLSNVVFAGDAFNVKLATGVTIDARTELTPSQPTMFLAANITPFTATYQAVNWTVVSGEQLATVNSNGILALTGAGNGSVTVQATTIDGSDLTAQKTIQVKNVITSVEIRTDRDVLTPTLYYTNLYAGILPSEMASSAVTWSIAEKSGSFDATLNGSYLTVSNITGDGVITVRATTTNGSGMFTDKTLQITTSSVTPVDAQTPNITSQPQSIAVSLNTPVTLSVTANVTDGGTLSYQWYFSSGGNYLIMEGATANTYSPNTSIEGTGYFYVVVKNNNPSATGEKNASIQSNTATVTVTGGSATTYTVSCGISGAYHGFVNATVNGVSQMDNSFQAAQGATVVFNAVPNAGYRVKSWTDNGATVNGSAATYTIGNISANHDVTVSFEADGGEPDAYTVTFDYNDGGSPVVVPVSGNNLTPVSRPSDPQRTDYVFEGWFTEANTLWIFTTPVTRNMILTAKWTPVTNAQTPTINGQPQNITANQNGSATLTVAAYVTDGGVLSFQWYSNAANNNTGGTAISGANGTSYSPPTNAAGTLYYYVVVTNANNSVNGTKTAIAVSNVATVTVNAQSVTGVETPDALPVRVYPNPTDGLMTLEFEADGVYSLTLADMTGKVLLRQKASGQSVQMDISNYPAGAYFVTIDDGKNQRTIRVVKN